MADPRNYITFKCQAAAAQQRSALKNFGTAVGKVGDLEVLNSIGGGKIGQGLRTIASVSNTIRGGCGSLPTIIGGTVEKGAEWVLGQTGISSAMVDAVRGFNPGIANQAWGQAKSIYDQVKQGRFKSTDIPGYLQDFQNLERLGRNIFTPGNVQGTQSVDCLNSPYAMDLIARAPKFKFMFVVSVIFEREYSMLMNVAEEMAFVVKRSTRPNIRFQTEEVNYYNFRTKVVTKTEFDEMSMTFHDDMTNRGMLFYNTYRNAMSPVTNLGGSDTVGLIDPENSGMDFKGLFRAQNPETSIKTSLYSGSRGPLLGTNKEILKSIRVFHVYDGGRRMNVFQFLNPRITEMALDDVDMSSSEGNEITVKFHYDSVYIHTNIPSNSPPFTNGSTMLPGSQVGAMYPLRFNGSASAMNAAHATISPYGYGTSGATQSCDPMNPITTSSNPLAPINGIGGALSGVADSVTNALSGFSQIGGVASAVGNITNTGIQGALSSGISSGLGEIRSAGQSIMDKATGSMGLVSSIFS